MSEHVRRPDSRGQLRHSLPEGLFSPLAKVPAYRLSRTASCDSKQSNSRLSTRVVKPRRASDASNPHLPALSPGNDGSRPGSRWSSRPGSNWSTRPSSNRSKSLLDTARSGPGSSTAAWRVQPNTPVFEELKTCLVHQPLVGTFSPLVKAGMAKTVLSPTTDSEKRLASGSTHDSTNVPALTDSKPKLKQHPLLAVFKDSWNNFELFAEFAELGQLHESHLLSSLGKRSTTMDFLELLELLKSLDVLADREGFYDASLTLTMTDVHNVFTAVNVKSYTQWWSSGGAMGDEDKNELVFEEYQMLMLALGKMMGLELDDMVEESGLEMFKNAGIDELIASAKKRSLVNRPGAARHLERLRNQENVQAGFISIEAANKACAEENFERARSLAFGAATAFIRHGRPDLLCEVRLLDNIITRREKSVSIHKRKIQAKVEDKLEKTTELAMDLKVEKAAAQLTEAGKMVESANLPMKGRLKKKFNAAGEALLCAEQAIEGDEKLAVAWDNIQRDSLDEGGNFLDEAKSCYGDISIRTVQVKNCEDALERKRESESAIRAGGVQLIDQARDDISNFRFDQAAKSLEEARTHFLEWTAPVGRNQTLVEGLTYLIKTSWSNKELYDAFSSYDHTNLSGQGTRACLMDFTELLHLLRYFGILSDKKLKDDKTPSIERSPSLPQSAAHTHKMELVDACTNEQIKAEPSCKLAKADVYDEFRAVNKKSMQDLLQGNIEADDDMSSLDFQEYQLLMLRVGKLLGLPMTDSGCSPLFLKDIREVEQMKETLALVKREAMQGIVHTGEKILLSARNLMQEKLFQEARDEVQLAVTEFNKLDDENLQRINMASCRRLAEQIDKEERKEKMRRADATAQAETAVKRAEQILADFDVMGARYDEHQFDICEREAEQARKFFKSAQAFGSLQKELIVDILHRAHSSREIIIKLRQAVSDGHDELDSAKTVIQHLLDTSSPPFEKVLSHLVDAKAFFVKAKVKDEVIEVDEQMVILVDMVMEWISSNVESGCNHVQQAEAILEKTDATQLKDAPETEGLFTQANAQHEIATRWFHKAKLADCVIQHQRAATQSTAQFDSLSRAKESKDDDQYKDELVQALKHRITDKHEAWLKLREKEVEDALKIVQECREHIKAKAFNASKEALKKAKQLLKGDREHVISELQRAISTAEMNDKESTKTIREQGLTILEVVREAVKKGDYELAFDSAEQAMELFDRARDNESMQELSDTRTQILDTARVKVEEATKVVRQCMEVGEAALQRKEFEEARCKIQGAKDALSDSQTLNALRVMATDGDSAVAADQKHLKEMMDDLEQRLEHQERQYGIVLQHERHQASILVQELQARAERASHTPLSRRHEELRVLRARFELAETLMHGEQDPALSSMRESLEAMERELEVPRAQRIARAARKLSRAELAAQQGSAKEAMAQVSMALRLCLEARDFDGVRRSVAARSRVIAEATQEKERKEEEALSALVDAQDASPTEAIAFALTAARTAAACKREELLLGFMAPGSSELAQVVHELEQIEGDANELRQQTEELVATKVEGLLQTAEERLRSVKEQMSETELTGAREGLLEVKDMLKTVRELDKAPPALLVAEVSQAEDALQKAEAQWRRDEHLLQGIVEDELDQSAAGGSDDPPPDDAGATTAPDDTAGTTVADESAAIAIAPPDESAAISPEALPDDPTADSQAPAETSTTPEAVDGGTAAAGQSADVVAENGGEVARRDHLLLHRLCKEGDLEVLERVLLHGPPLEDVDEQGWTALMHAVTASHVQCARKLISVGAEVNTKDNQGRTALMIAACATKIGTGLKTVGVLLEAGAQVTALDANGEHVLHHCARSGRDELIEEFLQRIGQETLSESLKSTAELPRAASTKSFRALSSGHSDDALNSAGSATNQMMEEILAEADTHQDVWVDRNSILLDSYSERGETPLTVAVKHGNLDAAKRIISWGANVRAKDSSGLGCLQCAAQRGDVAVIAALADQLREVDGVADGGGTALWFASSEGKLDAVEFLLARKAEPTLRDKQGWTPLHAACWAGGSQGQSEEGRARGEVIKVLMDHGLDPFSGDKWGRDALDVAVMFGSQTALDGMIAALGEEVIRYVCDHLLHVACWAGQRQTALRLIELGGQPMALTDSGFAPFHAACAKNRVELVRLLAGPKGSELPSADESWHSPVQICVLARSREALAAMLELRPEWSWAQDRHGWNALHVAALLGDSAAAQAIFDKAGGAHGGLAIEAEPALEMLVERAPSHGSLAAGQGEQAAAAPLQLFKAGDDAISIAERCAELARDGRALAGPDKYEQVLAVLRKHVKERNITRSSSVPTRTASQDEPPIERTGSSDSETAETLVRLSERTVRQWFAMPAPPEQHGLWRGVTKSMKALEGGVSAGQAEMALLSEFEDLAEKIATAEAECLRTERRKAVGLRTLVLQAHARVKSGNHRDAYSLMVRAEAQAGDREYERLVCLDQRAHIRETWLEGLGNRAKVLVDNGYVEESRAVLEEARGKAGWDGRDEEGAEMLLLVESRLIEREVHLRLNDLLNEVVGGHCQQWREDMKQRLRGLMDGAWTGVRQLKTALAKGKVVQDDVEQLRSMVQEARRGENEAKVLDEQGIEELETLDAQLERIEEWAKLQGLLTVAASWTSDVASWFSIELAQRAVLEAESNYRILNKEVATGNNPLDRGVEPQHLLEAQLREAAPCNWSLFASQAPRVRFQENPPADPVGFHSEDDDVGIGAVAEEDEDDNEVVGLHSAPTRDIETAASDDQQPAETDEADGGAAKEEEQEQAEQRGAASAAESEGDAREDEVTAAEEEQHASAAPLAEAEIPAEASVGHSEHAQPAEAQEATDSLAEAGTDPEQQMRDPGLVETDAVEDGGGELEQRAEAFQEDSAEAVQEDSADVGAVDEQGAIDSEESQQQLNDDVRAESERLEPIGEREDGDEQDAICEATSVRAKEEGRAASDSSVELVSFWQEDDKDEDEDDSFEAKLLSSAVLACTRASDRIEVLRSDLVRLELEVVMDGLIAQVEQNTVSDELVTVQARLDSIMARAEASREASEYSRCLQQLEEWEAIMRGGMFPAQMREVDAFVEMQDTVTFLLAIQNEAEERLSAAFALLEARDLGGARQQYAEARRRFRDARDKRSEKREQFYAFETSATREEVCALVWETVETAIEGGEEAMRAAATRALEAEIAVARGDLQKGDWRALQKHLEESEAVYRSAVGEGEEGHRADIEGLRAEAERLRRAEEATTAATEELTAAEDAIANGDLESARLAVERGMEITSSEALEAEQKAGWDKTWTELRENVDTTILQCVLNEIVTHIEDRHDEERSAQLRAWAQAAQSKAQTGFAALVHADAAALSDGLPSLNSQIQLDLGQAEQDGVAAEDQDVLLDWLQAADHCLQALGARVAAEEALLSAQGRIKRDLLQDRLDALYTSACTLQDVDAARPELPRIDLEWPSQLSPDSIATLLERVEASEASVQEELEKMAKAEEECSDAMQRAEAASDGQDWQACLGAVREVEARMEAIGEQRAAEVVRQAKGLRSRAEQGQRREELEKEVAAATERIPDLLANKMFDRAREVADRVLEHKRELLKLGKV